MGKATRKATKQMAVRSNLADLAMRSDDVGFAARKAQKKLRDSWSKRSGTPGDAHKSKHKEDRTVLATRRNAAHLITSF